MICISRHQQRGSFSAFMVIMIVSLVALSGLVFDGGRIIGAYLEMSDDAQNTARIGTQNIVSIRAGEPEIDPAQAHQDMSNYLQQQGHDATVYVTKESITVEIRKYVSMRVLNMFGISGRTISVRRTAQMVSQ
jgi:hypothetical protein